MAPRQGGRLRDAGRTRGAVVEAAVRARLERAGLRTLASNVASRGGELDLVMREPGAEGDTVVFVEVRYRAGHAFGDGLASVDAGKRRRLVHAAQAYLAAHPQLAELPCRFDVVAAHGDPASPHIVWTRDAFRLDEV